ncbi:aspartic peptidase domain-containing protein [Xylariales sp. AK1849]|nr:aspartic peptidase domain-containing protein [Xylariales sp. AK1849]
MPSTHLAAAILGTLLAASHMVHAEIEALWLEPSLKWYGIDGNWSAMGLFVGEPAQQVDVVVSTCLSEIWVVETGGCGTSALCTAARGNVYNISASNSWSPLGAWQLGLQYLGLGGNGDYANETVVVFDSATRLQTALQKQVVGAINDTGYYTGFFGLGITPGRFGSAVAPSPIAALVENDSVIPSHSYGYTAGAYYGGQWGTPMSLTLGGYDENRFIDHSTTFSLEPTTRLPRILVRGITALVPSVDKAPTEWSSPSLPLLSFNESVNALIDSSTPYLWLPAAVCDRFADALSLTWNETFGLYLFSDDAIFASFAEPDLSFTFTLSSIDNLDNLGRPLDVPGVVNITVSANAFAQTLRYPFMNAIEYGDAAIPYFPLKRTDNGSQVIIGRSFLQEAYMKMNYETSSFSVHQARFPDNPLRNTSIVTIETSNDNPYPGPTETAGGEEGLTKPAIVGIVIGSCLIVISVAFTAWWVRRKSRKQKAMNQEEDLKDSDSSLDSNPPGTPVARIFSRITRRFPGRKAKRGIVHEVSGDRTRAVEVGGNERYELAVPPEPVELDAADVQSINGTTELGTEETQSISAYEVARRKMDRQLQGPVPEYTPAPSPLESPFLEGGFDKGLQDISAVPHYRPSNRSNSSENRSLSPASTPTYDNLTYTLPSPLTPRGEWPPDRVPDISSPTMYAPPSAFTRSISNPGSVYTLPSPGTFDHRSLSRSASSIGSSYSPTGSLMPPVPTFRRTPIDPSKVVCLGPLPSNIRPPNPHRMLVPRPIGPDGHVFALSTIPSAAESRRASTADSLGSNFTVEEEAQILEDVPHPGTADLGASRGPWEDDEPEPTSAVSAGTLDGSDLVHIPQPSTPISATPNTGRLDTRSDLVHIPVPQDPKYAPTPSQAQPRLNGADLVHIPQPAEKRYSWED